MFDKLRSLFKAQPDTKTPDPEAGVRLAVAALLVEAARADEDYTEEEMSLIERILKSQFALDAAAVTTLRTDAEAAQEEANDLYRFTRVVKNDLDHEGKIELVENLWEIILSDAERHPHEEMLVRRLVGLIYVSDQESGAARQRVEAKLAS